MWVILRRRGEENLNNKTAQQHRQHFNLSDAVKKMLDELTAQRYPGKQRRQSQLVEDLIIEAFKKEYGSDYFGVANPQDGTEENVSRRVNRAEQKGRERITKETANVYKTQTEHGQHWRCPSCRRDVVTNWRFCVFCGGSLGYSCWRCNTLQPEMKDARFCFECGAQLK